MQASVADSAATNQNSSIQVLDVRGMQAPADVLSVLKRATELPPGESFELRADCNPWQLYDLLQQRGFFLEMQRLPDGSYTGKVRPRDLASLKP